MKHVWRWMLVVFPRSFRARFGAELREQLERDYERARARGLAAALWYAVDTMFDLLRSGVAEQWNPTWVAGAPDTRQGMRWRFDEWTTDLRHSLRSLKRTPGFTVMAVATLGIAMGANAGMFSVVKTVLLEPLPYAQMDRLVQITASAPGSDLPSEFGVAREFYVQYREQSQLLEDVAGFNAGTATLRVGDRVERVPMSFPTYSLFTTLGARPILGRLPVAEDESRVALISYGLWQSWFGGDRSVIGQTHEMAGAMRTIIGVMGPDFKFPSESTLLWVSSDIRPEGIRPGGFGLPLIARMKPGTTLDALRTELNMLAQRLPERFGGPASYVRIIEQHRAVVVPLDQAVLGSVARPLWVLLGACGIVLLIACANVANLFLVRAEGRHRDMAVRRAIGAARRQLIRLQMSEALIVAGLAGVVGVFLAALTLPAFLRAAPPDVPRLADVGLDASTLLFTLLAGVIAALVCGAIPALRGSAPDLTRLREGGRGSTRKRHYARDLLVVGQTSLALVLLIGSALLVRSYWGLKHVDPGYDTKDLFTFQFAADRPQLNDGPTWAQFTFDFMDRMSALPGVQSVGLVENIPLNEGFRSLRFRVEGAEPDTGPLLGLTFTAGDYFSSMGISLLQGRTFDRTDHRTGQLNAIVSRSAAQMLWPNQDPIGRRMQSPFWDTATWATVVGVVEDVMQYSFRDTPQPLVYLPLVGPTANSWAISSPAYVLKTARAETIAPEVRALVREVAPEAPMYRVFTMAGLARDSMVQLSFTMLTLGIASGLALLLGAIGLYGVLSYVVAQRTREIGVRMALGARAQQVRLMVVAQGARVVGVGVLIGFLAALASTRALGSLLFGVAPFHAATFAGMSASMVAVGLLASYVPARRASNVDPIETMRGD